MLEFGENAGNNTLIRIIYMTIEMNYITFVMINTCESQAMLLHTICK